MTKIGSGEIVYGSNERCSVCERVGEVIGFGPLLLCVSCIMPVARLRAANGDAVQVKSSKARGKNASRSADDGSNADAGGTNELDAILVPSASSAPASP